jgi:hypothetical protein
MALTTNATTPLNVTLSDNATETVNPPATVKFDTTVANGEEPYSFSWDFGDGTRETRTDGNKVHTFDTEGLYNVTVDVIDSLNSTGSANTLVNVTDKNTGSEPAVASEGNLTQERQTTESANRTNTTTTTAPAAQDNNNNTTETNNNGESTNSPSANVNNNSPPIANAGNDITGKPNEKVTLDATKSTDPDEGDMIESYQWKQESGPAAKIDNKNSPTPIVTLPDVNKDATLVFSLTVNDGTVDSEKQDTISIFVNHIDELSSDVQEKILKPADAKSSQWILSDACKEQGEVECLSDGSGETFVSAGTDSVNDVNLYSFGQFTAGEGVDVNSLVIDRVTAEISAKKAGNTGYISFVIDDPKKEEHYVTPSISIASNNSFQNYDYAWDTNPVTGEKWTFDSVNSLLAGFKYDGGQSGVQISELQLTIGYHLPKPLPANDTTTGEAAANDNSQANPNENSSERDSTSATPQNTEPQEPSSNTDNKNSTSPSADENDSSPEE